MEADRIRRLILDYISVPDDASEPVEVSGKTFVLSGQFALGDKKSVVERIEARGGRDLANALGEDHALPTGMLF